MPFTCASKFLFVLLEWRLVVRWAEGPAVGIEQWKFYFSFQQFSSCLIFVTRLSFEILKASAWPQPPYNLPLVRWKSFILLLVVAIALISKNTAPGAKRSDFVSLTW